MRENEDKLHSFMARRNRKLTLSVGGGVMIGESDGESVGSSVGE